MAKQTAYRIARYASGYTGHDPLAHYRAEGTLAQLTKQYGSARKLAEAELANWSEDRPGQTYKLTADGAEIATALNGLVHRS